MRKELPYTAADVDAVRGVWKQEMVPLGFSHVHSSRAEIWLSYFPKAVVLRGIYATAESGRQFLRDRDAMNYAKAVMKRVYRSIQSSNPNGRSNQSNRPI